MEGVCPEPNNHVVLCRDYSKGGGNRQRERNLEQIVDGFGESREVESISGYDHRRMDKLTVCDP